MAWFGGTAESFVAGAFQHMRGRSLYLTVESRTVEVRRADGQPLVMLNRDGEPMTKLMTNKYGFLPLFEVPDLPEDTDFLQVKMADGFYHRLYRNDRLTDLTGVVPAVEAAAANAAASELAAEVAASEASALVDGNFAAWLEDPESPSHAVLSATYVRPSRIEIPVASNVALSDGAASPRPTECYGGYFWGTGSDGKLHRSTDGVSWTQVGSTPPARFHRFFECTDGEILGVSPDTDTVYRSTGWASNPATATWATVATKMGGPTASLQTFGISGDGTKFILTEYCAPIGAASRYGRISLDGGLTWDVVWDTVEEFPATHAESHIHAACYDPWEDRFWLSEGHGGPCGIYFSEDDGATWTRLTGGIADTVQPAPTVMTATDDGIVCGSDADGFSTYGIPRTADSSTLQLFGTHRWRATRDGAAGFAEVGWRDPTTGLVYIAFNSQGAGSYPIVTAGTATRAAQVWEGDTDGSNSRAWFAAVIDDVFIAHTQIPTNEHYLALGRVGRKAQASNAEDAGNAVTGAVGAGYNSSVAVGIGAQAAGPQSVVIGYQATALSEDPQAENTIVGALAKTLDDTVRQCVVVGQEAISNGTSSVAIGQLSVVGTTAVAVGQSAVASGQLAVAIGFSADATGVGSISIASNNSTSTDTIAIGRQTFATHARSVALGYQSVTSAADQFSIGVRHIEMAENTTIPIAPPADKGRLYVRDNGAGSTQLCAKFATGGEMVLVGQSGVRPLSAFTTAGRPAATAVPAGSAYYDTTLSKPGWSDGAAWKDAAGVAI